MSSASIYENHALFVKQLVNLCFPLNKRHLPEDPININRAGVERRLLAEPPLNNAENEKYDHYALRMTRALIKHVEQEERLWHHSQAELDKIRYSEYSRPSRIEMMASNKVGGGLNYQNKYLKYKHKYLLAKNN